MSAKFVLFGRAKRTTWRFEPIKTAHYRNFSPLTQFKYLGFNIHILRCYGIKKNQEIVTKVV
jgi:hypothetical protein